MTVIFGPTQWQYLICNPPPPGPGEAYGGGYLICKDGYKAWVVAPSSTEVSRSWYCRNDAVTTANANAACGDWFVPTCGQLQTPGYTCRTYWDSYSSGHLFYWSSTESTSSTAWLVCFDNDNGNTYCYPKTLSYCVRAFRCVTY